MTRKQTPMFVVFTLVISLIMIGATPTSYSDVIPTKGTLQEQQFEWMCSVPHQSISAEGILCDVWNYMNLVYQVVSNTDKLNSLDNRIATLEEQWIKEYYDRDRPLILTNKDVYYWGDIITVEGYVDPRTNAMGNFKFTAADDPSYKYQISNIQPYHDGYWRGTFETTNLFPMDWIVETTYQGEKEQLLITILEP